MNAGTADGAVADRPFNVTIVTKEGRMAVWSKEDARFGYRESHFPRGSVVISARFLLKKEESEAIKARVQKYRANRVETQPLNVPNLGSVFKNPPASKKSKLFAGRLIEDTGLKSIRVGGARISPKHANFIVNEGGASAKDVLVLIGLVRDKVKERFGLLLEPEVRVVGEE